MREILNQRVCSVGRPLFEALSFHHLGHLHNKPTDLTVIDNIFTLTGIITCELEFSFGFSYCMREIPNQRVCSLGEPLFGALDFCHLGR